MLSDFQKQEFSQSGLVHIPNAFSEKQAVPMREVICAELERQYGIDPEDPATWHSDIWPKFNDIKFDPVFDPIGSSVTRDALDEILGKWQEPSNWGQFAVQFPKQNCEWEVPHYLWHTDFAFDAPADPLPGVLLISFITDVGPKSGGTGFVTGSHRLVENYVESKGREFCKKMRRVRESLMLSDPWLVDLANPDLPDREQRLVNNEFIVDGCRLRVHVSTGDTGDIVIAHPWLLHASSVNCGDSLSMRRVQRIHACA